MERRMNTYKVIITAEVSFCPDYWGGNIEDGIYEILSENFLDHAKELQYEEIATETFNDEDNDEYF